MGPLYSLAGQGTMCLSAVAVSVAGSQLSYYSDTSLACFPGLTYCLCNALSLIQLPLQSVGLFLLTLRIGAVPEGEKLPSENQTLIFLLLGHKISP